MRRLSLRKKRTVKITTYMVLFLMLMSFFSVSSFALEESSAKNTANIVESGNNVKSAGTAETSDIIYYADVLKSYDLNKASNAGEETVDLATGVKADGTPANLEQYRNMSVIKWDTGETGYKFRFSAEAGLYTIRISYIPLAETTADIVRSIKIDDTSRFIEMQNIKLPRCWVSDGNNYFDYNDDERAATLKQEEKLLRADVRDLYGLYSEPLLFDLEKGTHTITLESVSGTCAIQGIELIPYQPLENYRQYAVGQESSAKYDGESVMVQGEAPSERSDRTLNIKSVKDAAMSPFKLGSIRLNAIGDWNWRNGNEEITWKINAPKDGLYKLTMRVKQDYNNLVTYRQVKVDGTVLFQELSAYPFYASAEYKTIVLGGETPYLFYLKEGEHTLSMSAVTGELTPVINELQALSRTLSKSVREIQTITGTIPDPNFDYELAKKMPWLLSDLTEYSQRITALSEKLKTVCKSNPALIASLLSEADKLSNMIRKPETIPQKVADLSTMQGLLADYSITLKSMPLAVDYIELTSPDRKIVQRTSSLWDRIKLQVVDFIQSFTKDYSNTTTDNKEEMKSINVWVSRGRDWGETIQRMADEAFTPKYNVKIKVNILPPGYTTVINGASPLLLSIVSGQEPDIAMGSDMDTPIELAIRGTTVDLSKLDGFSEVANRFAAGAISPFSYQGGVYALPETMDIPLLIYRTDIFKEYSIPVPQTWEELWIYTLPKLKQISAKFSMVSQPDNAVNTAKLSMYATFLFQNGGEFYKKDGTSALDSELAYKAFYAWTKNFIQYQSPQATNFYNEMRIGTIPIGIGYMGDYLMLDIAAPELYGRFDIAPIPGVRNEKGEIVRYGAGSVSSAMLFKKAALQDEAWEFIKWWTQGSTQEQFASEIEAKVGPTARWFSANLEAYFSLPWGKDRANIIKEWLPWYKNAYNTLGGYMTSRSVNNAWTRTVLSGMKPRDSLEQAFTEINIQVERKKKEYGVK